MRKKATVVLSVIITIVISLSFILTSCTIDSKASILTNKSILALKSDKEIAELQKKDSLIEDIDPLNSLILRSYNSEDLVNITIYQRVTLDAQQRIDIDFNTILNKFKEKVTEEEFKNQILSPIVNIFKFEKQVDGSFKLLAYVVDLKTVDLGNNKFKLTLKYNKLEKTVEAEKIKSFVNILDNPKMKKADRTDKGLKNIINRTDFIEISESEYIDNSAVLVGKFFRERSEVVLFLPAMPKEKLPEDQKYKVKKMDNKVIEYSKELNGTNYEFKYTFNKKTLSFVLDVKSSTNDKIAVDFINGVDFGFYQLSEQAK